MTLYKGVAPDNQSTTTFNGTELVVFAENAEMTASNAEPFSPPIQQGKRVAYFSELFEEYMLISITPA